MPLGEKWFEEKGRMTMTYIESIDSNGVVMKQSFESDLKGMGKFPSGKNMGSGTIYVKPSGKAHGKWQGILMTADGEMVTWHGKGQSVRAGPKVKGVMLLSFMTISEKLKWMNMVTGVMDITGDMMEFASVGNEWK